MRVKFANTSVDVWKLKKGTVLLKYARQDLAPEIYHLEGVVTVMRDCASVKVMISDAHGSYEILTTELYWSEPH